jgi:hypothetical protein
MFAWQGGQQDWSGVSEEEHKGESEGKGTLVFILKETEKH